MRAKSVRCSFGLWSWIDPGDLKANNLKNKGAHTKDEYSRLDRGFLARRHFLALLFTQTTRANTA